MSVFQVPQFQAVLTMLGLSEGLINFESSEDRKNLRAFIQKWVEADQFSATEPRKFLELFGYGFALFVALPDYVRNAESSGESIFGTAIRTALSCAAWVATTNKIRVTFTENGSVFN